MAGPQIDTEKREPVDNIAAKVCYYKIKKFNQK